MEAFISYLLSKIDINYYDSLINLGGFHIGKTINFKSNVNSDYLLLLNLSDEKLSLLKSKTVVDDQLLEMVEKTYKTVLHQKEKTKIMYDPPMLNHIVDNGNLVFEFSYGKNTNK